MTTGFTAGRGEVISYPVTVNGVRTRVVESVRGEIPMVCIHGVGSRADRFTPVSALLSRAGFRVFAIDLPGHGLADKPAPADFDYRPRGYAQYVSAVLDALGLSEVVFVGTSLGGHIGARIACDRPDLIAGLVLIGTMGIAPLAEADMVPPANVATGSVEAVTSKLGFLVSDPAMVHPAWVREESMINSSSGAHDALYAAAGFVNSEANADTQAGRLAAERADLPTVIVWGADDRWTPLSMGLRSRELLPHAVFHAMEGCGHAPYFEDPQQFTDIVTQHLAGRSPAAESRSEEEFA
ncbi:alpha/beta fold hydrolase [Gordonia sp. NPDC003376]